MYDGIVFADRFRYQFAMFNITILIGLSLFLHAHNAYEIDAAKIVVGLCRISYCLYDLIGLDTIACRVQTTKYTMM